MLKIFFELVGSGALDWVFWTTVAIVAVREIIIRIRGEKEKREARQLFLWILSGGSPEDWRRENEEWKKIAKLGLDMLIFILTTPLTVFAAVYIFRWELAWPIPWIVVMVYIAVYLGIGLTVIFWRVISFFRGLCASRRSA